MRKRKKTIFFFGEGLGEVVFLKHLKSLYSYTKKTFIRIVMGRGGTAEKIVSDASRQVGDFNKKVIVLDNDKPKKEMIKARQLARSKKFELIENTPCLEYILLSILLDKQKLKKKSSWCKKQFKSNYISKTKRKDQSEYVKLFPKKLLEKKKRKIKELNKMILIMKGR